MSVPNKEEILEALFDEAFDTYVNDGLSKEQARMLAEEDAIYRYENGLYNQGDYDND